MACLQPCCILCRALVAVTACKIHRVLWATTLKVPGGVPQTLFHGVYCCSIAPIHHCLQESLADYIIFWDDDIKPEAACLSAYIAAFQKHPQVLPARDSLSNIGCGVAVCGPALPGLVIWFDHSCYTSCWLAQQRRSCSTGKPMQTSTCSSATGANALSNMG